MTVFRSSQPYVPIIAGARIALRPLPLRGRVYRLRYGNVNTALRDLRRCVEEGLFRHSWKHLLSGPGKAVDKGHGDLFPAASWAWRRKETGRLEHPTSA